MNIVCLVLNLIHAASKGKAPAQQVLKVGTAQLQAADIAKAVGLPADNDYTILDGPEAGAAAINFADLAAACADHAATGRWEDGLVKSAKQQGVRTVQLFIQAAAKQAKTFSEVVGAFEFKAPVPAAAFECI